MNPRQFFTWTVPRLWIRVALALAVAWAGVPIAAQNITWQSTGSGSWNVTTNWSPNGLPNQNSSVLFTSGAATLTTTNDIPSPSPLLINSLTVDSNVTGPVSIAGNPLSVQNGVSVAS